MIENLEKLRVPFPANQISYLPKGGVKLAYVGHAALTDRLLDVDTTWTWEPLALDSRGLPALDEAGGLWIKLTVCGVTRLGYGDAGTKKGGDAMKERIGDALRNAAMRFGAALDLWHKGDLHGDEDVETPAQRAERERKAKRGYELEQFALDIIDMHQRGKDLDAFKAWYSVEAWSADHDEANEERLYVWGLLKNESKLRSAIKSNRPVDKAEAWKAGMPAEAAA